MIRCLAIGTFALIQLFICHEVFGRGFGGGGFRGGGFGGGGFRGGGFGGGEFGRGGFGGGGFRGGDMGGYRGAEGGRGFGGERGALPGGFRDPDMGGIRGGSWAGFRGGEDGGFRGGAAPSRSEMNRFLELPSDGGMHSVASDRSAGGFNVDRGVVEGPHGGVAGGTSVTGPRGNTVDRGAAIGPNGGVAAGRAVVGAGGGAAARGIAAGPGGRVVAGGVARDGAVGGLRYMSPSSRYAAAYGVRSGFAGYGLYTPAWYGAHLGAWAAAGLAADAWDAASWSTMNDWFGTSTAPLDYDYGSNVVTQDDNIYVDGEDAGTTNAYYEQAAGLAKTGADAPTADDQKWLPLGVFAMTRDDQNTSNMVIQLAVNKQGLIRGNFTDTKTNQTLGVQGSVDRKTQRAAWTIGDKKNDVIETGLYNLTKDEFPALLHFGKDRTEQWLFVRMQQKDSQEN